MNVKRITELMEMQTVDNSPLTLKGEHLFRNHVPVFINMYSEKKKNGSEIHKHDFMEIVLVMSGKGVHYVGSEEYRVAKGDLFIINYDVPHIMVQDDEGKEGDFLVYNCVFKPEFIDFSLINGIDLKDLTSSFLFNPFIIAEKPVIHLSLSGTQQAEVEEIYQKMHLEYTLTAKGYVNILRSCVIELLTKIFRLIDDTHIQTTPNNKQEIIRKALDFLQRNYGSGDLSENEVAGKIFLSRSYFSRLFKDVTGRYFFEYLQNLRISEACKLLETTDYKVSEIMIQVGFRDIKHFNLLFKRITGKTPKEYRKVKASL